MQSPAEEIAYWRKQGKWQQAQEVAGRALTEWPNHASIRNAVCWLYLDMIRHYARNAQWQKMQDTYQLVAPLKPQIEDDLAVLRLTEVAIDAMHNFPKAADWPELADWVQYLNWKQVNYSQYASLLTASLPWATKTTAWLDFLLWWNLEHLQPADFYAASESAITLPDQTEIGQDISLAEAVIDSVLKHRKLQPDYSDALHGIAQQLLLAGQNMGAPMTYAKRLLGL